jgi:response regulator NasT
VIIFDSVKGIAARIAALEPDVIVIDLENPNRDMLETFSSLPAWSKDL